MDKQPDSVHQTSDAVVCTVPLGWLEVRRPLDASPTLVYGKCPIWVSHYPKTSDRAEFWQGYRAVEKAPAGRQPWSVNNKRIGSERGFASLEAAIAACEEFATKEPQ